MAEDFSEWTLEWGSQTVKLRGRFLLETTTDLDVVLANIGMAYTFKLRSLRSKMDLT